MWWRNSINVVGGCRREASRTSSPPPFNAPKDKSSPSQLAALATDVGFPRRKRKSYTRNPRHRSADITSGAPSGATVCCLISPLLIR